MATLDVILQFRQSASTPDETGGVELYQVDVVSAPGRGWGGPMSPLGVDMRQGQALREFFHDYVVREQTAAQHGQKESDFHSFRLVGDKLFNMLPETVQDQLRRSQAVARSKGHHLGLVLRFDMTAWGLLDLPWELLHDPLHRQFFALSGGGVSRQVVLPAIHKTPETFQPEAVLGVWAEPVGLPDLAVRRKNGPAPGRSHSITWLEGANSLQQLENALGTQHYDALHIVAHGSSTDRNEFVLALEGVDGKARWCTASELATLLSEYPQLKFVYLDICHSGGRATTLSKLAIGNVATTVMGAGVPAAIVMQEEMGQESAGVMAQAFYQALSGEATLAEAVTRSRRVARLQHNDPIHWGLPALYTQIKVATGEPAHTWADWVVDHIIGRSNLFLYLFPGLVVPILIAHLAYLLSFIHIFNPNEWLPLAAVLIETSLVPILVAALSQQGQEELGKLHNLQGWQDWLPPLLHKYLSAFVTPMILAWLPLWAVWFGLYGAGLGGQLSQIARQVIWTIGLSGVAMAAHIGTRQALRQNRLFLSYKFSFYTLSFSQFIPLLGMLFAPPLLGVLGLWSWNRILVGLGLPPAIIGVLTAASVLLITLGLAVALVRDQPKQG